MIRLPATGAGLVLVLAAGCKFTAPNVGDAGLPSPDVAHDADLDAPPDVPVLPLSCMDRWRAGTVNLGAPVHLAQLGSVAVERDPYISKDELTLHFSTNRVGHDDGDFFVATRSSLSEPFSAGDVDMNLSSLGSEDTRVSMTKDGLTALVASQRQATPSNDPSDFWIARRGDTGQLFGAFSREGLGSINDASAQRDPEINADGSRIYGAIGEPQRIVVSSRAGQSSNYMAPQDVPGVNSGVGDADPSLSEDERVIVFASRRDNDGDVDLWYAHRAAADQPFEAPIRVPNLNSSHNDGDPSLSADGCRLYFASDRPEPAAGWELYVAEVVP